METKTYYQRNKSKFKLYYEQHKDRIKKRSAKQYYDDPAKRKAYMKEYYRRMREAYVELKNIK